MKSFKSILLLLAVSFSYTGAFSQNVLLNILTQNSGMVSKGRSVFVELTVCNTSSTTAVPAYKIRPQVSVPSAIAGIPDTGHILPPGWTVISIDKGVIRLSNGTDQLLPNDCRTIFIAIKGNNIGGPLTVSGNLLFSNGVPPGSASGPATAADNPADNTSTSTCTVTR